MKEKKEKQEVDSQTTLAIGGWTVFVVGILDLAINFGRRWITLVIAIILILGSMMVGRGQKKFRSEETSKNIIYGRDKKRK